MIGNDSSNPSRRRWRLALFSSLALLLASLTLAAEPAEPVYSVDLLRQDFDALYLGLQAAHYDLYARRDKADYDRLHAQMRAAIDAPMSLQQAEVYFQRFVAYGDIAHARIDFPAAAWETYRSQGGKALPLYPQYVGNRFHVGESLDEAIPAGVQLTHLQGEPIDHWYQRTRRHLSADSDYLARALLEFRFPALLWLELGEQASYTVGWIDAQGKARHSEIAALSQAQLRAAAAASAATERAERELQLLDKGIAYLRPGPFYHTDPQSTDPWDPTTFIAFVDDAFAQIQAAGSRALLIDLRDNPGGDSSFSDPLVAWFADRPFRFYSRLTVRSSEAARQSNLARLRQAGERGSPVSERYEALYAEHPPGSEFELEFPSIPPRTQDRYQGPVYLLINRHSYSNAVTLAALAQDYGFARILGEETSDLASTYGAMEHFQLPGSGIQVGFPKARIIRPNGDTSPRGVIPDVSLRTPIGPGAWQAVLDQAVAQIVDELGDPAGPAGPSAAPDVQGTEAEQPVRDEGQRAKRPRTN